MNIQTWIAFFSVALIATMLPGPAMLLIATHSLSYGWVKTIATILGNVTGLVMLSLLSVLGLGVLIICSHTAFLGIKIIGAAYLFYLGAKLWMNGIKPLSAQKESDAKKPSAMYLQGIFLALSNPKAILFTTALFPQFIDASRNISVQFIILVATLGCLSFTCLLTCAIISRKSFTSFGNSKISRIINKVFGGVFMGTGVTLVTTAKSTG
jgi:homoserine/homoserine lactone efflux protein